MGFLSHSYMEAPSSGGYMLAIIDRGADALAASGAITEETAGALKARRGGDQTPASSSGTSPTQASSHRSAEPAQTRNTFVVTIDNVPSFPVSRRQAITATLGLAVLLLLAARWLDRPVANHVGGASVRVRAAPAVRPRVTVDVTGAVRRPGLYLLPDGSRVADALERAGGPTRKAFLEAVNLAAPPRRRMASRCWCHARRRREVRPSPA